MGISTSPCTTLFEPSKALTTMLLGFKVNPSQSCLSRAFLGNTFRDEPVSTKTCARVVPYIPLRHATPHYAFFPLASDQHLKNLNHYPQLGWPHSLEIDQQMSLEVHGRFLRTSPRLLRVPRNIVVMPAWRSYREFSLVVQLHRSRFYYNL